MSDGSISVGAQHGPGNRGRNNISLGNKAGFTGQHRDAIAIGYGAGHRDQGDTSIAIGRFAGSTSRHAHTIVVNATGKAMNTQHTNATLIGPVNETTPDPKLQLLAYDLDTVLVVSRPPDLGIVGVKSNSKSNYNSDSNSESNGESNLVRQSSSLSFQLATGAMSTVTLPRMGDPGSQGPRGACVDQIVKAPDRRTAWSTIWVRSRAQRVRWARAWPMSA
ncbi:hypothetical protein SARC_06539 [Sphaeroforma arctica JP610]|uniref:Trimeric autotransporter adhesin YadA-like head domain-containing protein n=1 Tax=Sphaeroforma arctica JP610 TaxID=667725 RepID=A0A0L0FWW6_9EUKA|nr:hypothetical protein SARC_06539 [Sphaeroforma arctica JP610]KNC81114.1 hypothetical protein SARC_06539 [Sphaeroforma arctica JP610]|eukprot:XP_014155016.1 hypothetical protein SARC_06539 [Sphaeroforma arctica JP610]